MQVNGPEAWDVEVEIDVVVTNQEVQYRLWFSNSALIYNKATQVTDAEVTVTGTARALAAFAVCGLDPEKLEEAGLEIEGDTAALVRLAAVLQKGDPNSNIVLP